MEANNINKIYPHQGNRGMGTDEPRYRWATD